MKNKQKSEVRPLTSRALTSAMDTLRPYIAQSRVLDLYAGAGRFGLSALEEGASSCTFVEKSRKEADSIGAQIRKFKFNGTVCCEDVTKYLGHAAEMDKFEIIFADPPFPLWNAPFVENLFTSVSRVISQEGIFLVKYPDQMVAFDPPNRFRPWKKTRFGESLLLYFLYGE